MTLVLWTCMQCEHITKKIMDLTRKKHVVKWETSPVGVFKLRHSGFDTFFGTSRSCVSVSRRSRDVFLERLVSSRSWGFNVSVSSRSCDLTSCGHHWSDEKHRSRPSSLEHRPGFVLNTALQSVRFEAVEQTKGSPVGSANQPQYWGFPLVGVAPGFYCF